MQEQHLGKGTFGSVSVKRTNNYTTAIKKVPLSSLSDPAQQTSQSLSHPQWRHHTQSMPPPLHCPIPLQSLLQKLAGLLYRDGTSLRRQSAIGTLRFQLRTSREMGSPNRLCTRIPPQQRNTPQRCQTVQHHAKQRWSSQVDRFRHIYLEMDAALRSFKLLWQSLLHGPRSRPPTVNYALVR